MKIDRRDIRTLSILATTFLALVLSEGFREPAYQDSGTVWTIGFGSTRMPNGAKVKKGDTITVPMALTLAMREELVMEDAVKRCMPYDLHQYEFDAYMQLAYNVGTGAVCGSTIPLKVAMGDYAGACKAILDFDGFRDTSKPKVKNPRTGKWEYPLVRLKGLTNRRQREYKQCLGE